MAVMTFHTHTHIYIYWECHHPNLRTHIFARGSNHQPVVFWSVSASATAVKVMQFK